MEGVKVQVKKDRGKKRELQGDKETNIEKAGGETREIQEIERMESEAVDTGQGDKEGVGRKEVEVAVYMAGDNVSEEKGLKETEYYNSNARK